MYFYLADYSPYPDDYPITTINIAPVAIINTIKSKPKFDHFVIDQALKLSGETLITTQPAKDLLFGYKDKFLTALKTIDKKLVPTEYVGLFYGVIFNFS
jgi:hypothetical protein